MLKESKKLLDKLNFVYKTFPPKDWVQFGIKEPNIVVDTYPSLMSQEDAPMVSLFQTLPNTGIGVREYSLRQIAAGAAVLVEFPDRIDDAVIAVTTTEKFHATESKTYVLPAKS